MKKYFKQIFKLFLPLFIARIGMFSLSLVDSIMLGYSDSDHVGMQSIGDTPVSIILLMLNGLLQGTLFTTSHAFGKNDFIAVGQSLRSALTNGLFLSLITIPCLIFAPQIISLLNYDPKQIQIVSSITRILCATIPFSIMFFICTSFLNGIKKTWIVTVFTILANIINLFLNWILINGLFGFPRLLSIGAACSTSVVRFFMGGGLLLYVLLNPKFKKFQIWNSNSNNNMIKKQQKLGLSATSNMISYEIGAAFCLFYAANISITDASAYTLSYRIFILSNIVGSCFAIAGTILSGKYSNNNLELSKIYQTSIFANILIMFSFCTVCFLVSSYISSLMTSDVNLSKLTSSLLQITCIAMLMRSLNSIQIILLRNIDCLLIPSLIYNFCFICLTPLLCFWLGSSFSTSGIMWSLTISNACVVIFLHYIFMKKNII